MSAVVLSGSQHDTPTAGGCSVADVSFFEGWLQHCGIIFSDALQATIACLVRQ
jgi:hypothetical protein